MTRRAPLVAAALVAVAGLAAAASPQGSSRPSDADTIRMMLRRLHDNGDFTGSVLVARAGVPVYREGIASTAAEAETLLTTPADIASIAKGFTAMAVMQLAGQGKLRYDDPLARHVPELKDAVPAITIRHLLTNTSGIPDVGDLGIDRPDLREADVVEAVRTQHARFARPGVEYRYSNTGYVLLGMVVERAAGRPFDEVVASGILRPLGMTSTRPIGGPRGAGATKGDAGYASTVDDLLAWDQALATARLLPAQALAEAFTPARVEKGATTYGFGWNITAKDGDTRIWHTGNSGGRRAYVGRRVRDGITTIILTRGNSRRLEIADAVDDILRGRPYTAPRLSLAPRLLKAIDAQGIDAAVALHETLRTTDANTYDFSEGELNGLGYTLLGRNDAGAAIKVFELNTRQYPASSNTFDSLGEAYQQAGRTADAVKAYTRAVELDPHNLNAQTRLRALAPTGR